MSDRPSPLNLVLFGLVALTGITAIPAGLALLAEPSGAYLALDPALLHRGPFTDFSIPGVFLLVVIGLGAVPVVWGLGAGDDWGTVAGLGYGLVLLAWITVQAIIVGIISPLQPIFGTIGLLIVAFALAVRQAERGGG